VRLVFHDHVPENEVLRRSWNALVHQMERPEVFYTYEWALALQRAYGATLRPLLFLGYSGEELMAVAALGTRSGSDGVFFLAGETADYCDFVSRPKVRPEFVAFVLADLAKRNLPSLILENLPADSATSDALNRVSRRTGHKAFSRTAFLCSQISFRTHEQRDKVLRSFQTPSFRHHARALEKLAPVTVEHLTCAQAMQSTLPSFYQAHVARFLRSGRVSYIASRDRRLFFTELAGLLSDSQSAVLSRLMSGDRPIAWNFGFRFGASWFWYQPTFDGKFYKYSPGLYLLSKLTAEACANPAMDRVDMGLGAESYKEPLATGKRKTLHITLTRSLVTYCHAALRHHVASVVKSSPRLERQVRTCLRALVRLGNRYRREGGLRLMRSCFRRLANQFVGRTEIRFFEFAGSWKTDRGALTADMSLQEVTPQLLAQAVMQYIEDQETIEYLLRAATRLNVSGVQAFALVDERGIPVHFCWTEKFDGFYVAELKQKIRISSQECMLLFDCWTPPSVRGRGHYQAAISRLAMQVQSTGKRAWIFSSSGNPASQRGIEKVGFEFRFSLQRKQTITGRKVITQVDAPVHEKTDTHSECGIAQAALGAPSDCFVVNV
jgi:CelD/BcsL family acetyltransferase involved in cellulose biosynthesis